MSWEAIDRIGDLVQFFEEDKSRIEALKFIQKSNEEQSNND